MSGAVERAAASGPARDAAATLLPVACRLDDHPTLASVLRGEWLGHPLHPVLTDLPIGFWTSAWVLDLLPGNREAARRLVGLGVLSAIPTALAGAADWPGISRRRDGVVALHIAANTSATLCFAVSWRERRRGHHGRGVMWGQLGAIVATLGGYLGGHLVFGSDDTSETTPDAHPVA